MTGRMVVRRALLDLEFEIDDLGDKVVEEEAVTLSIFRVLKRIVEGSVELVHDDRQPNLFSVVSGSRTVGTVTVE